MKGFNHLQDISTQSLSQFGLQRILGVTDVERRKTKIICTIGPSCWDVPVLCEMLEAGMNIARLNFSHGDHEAHKKVFDRLKEAFKIKKDKPCAILLDTKGPEIRTGMLVDHKPIQLKKDQLLEITNDYTFEGTTEKIACSYKSIAKSMVVGGKVLIADGSIVGIVDEIKENSIVIRVQNESSLGERKNMNLPGVQIDLPTVTAKDDIVNFALKHGCDMIALSFTRSGKDIEQVRDLLGPKGSFIQIISKIENQEGLHNFDEILAHTDGIMVARGDLGMEIPPQKVFVAQKWMIRKCNQAGKPVVTATQMMESMIKNPRPSRAEASDVANAVLDGTDAVMLSGETANGSFPVGCIQIMAEICREGELTYSNEINFWNRTQRLIGQKVKEQESMAIAAIQARIIVVFTVMGNMPKLISKYRPLAQIIAVSNEHGTMKALTVSQGVRALRVPSFDGIENLIDYAIQYAKEKYFCEKGDKAVIIMGKNEEDQDQDEILKIKTIY